METTHYLGNEKQLARAEEIIAALPAGAQADGPKMQPGINLTFVDVTMIDGIEWRFSIHADGRVSRNRKLAMG
jgi:hypothetical protein